MDCITFLSWRHFGLELALGVGRLERSGQLTGAWTAPLGNRPVGCGTPLEAAMIWSMALLEDREQSPHSMISLIREDTGGVLAHPMVAPLLF